MSNFTDVDPLAAEPGVCVRFTESPAEVRTADLAVLPGTKATVADLGWLRARGLDRALAARAAGGMPVLGVCGGYQMLGLRVVDHVESGGEARGLGLLPVETVFGEGKVLARPAGTAPFLGGVRASGYEIHHGRVARLGGEPLFVRDDGEAEGCRAGTVLGTSWHGVLECDGLRRALCRWVAGTSGLRWMAGTSSFAELRDRRLDRLGDLIEEHLDTGSLLRLIEAGPPPGLPVLSGRLEGGRSRARAVVAR